MDPIIRARSVLAMAGARRALSARHDFNPDQPRAANGEFGEGGSGGGGGGASSQGGGSGGTLQAVKAAESKAVKANREHLAAAHEARQLMDHANRFGTSSASPNDLQVAKAARDKAEILKAKAAEADKEHQKAIAEHAKGDQPASKTTNTLQDLKKAESGLVRAQRESRQAAQEARQAIDHQNRFGFSSPSHVGGSAADPKDAQAARAAKDKAAKLAIKAADAAKEYDRAVKAHAASK